MTMKSLPATLFVIAMLAASGCGSGNAVAEEAVGEPTAVGVVDSIFPIEEELRRFRATLAEHPQALDEAAPSRDALVARFVAALQATDTAELRRMALTRAEFAYLYYPTAQFAQPPYELSPALVWYRLESYSSRGLVRALDRFGGRPLRVTGHDCEESPLVQGGNRIWHGCVLHARDAADSPVSLSLLGPVLEREGEFKMLSYANGL
jgi:hypothetical protein